MIIGNRGNHSHSLETRKKISASIKKKWEDEEYRNKISSISPSEDVRERISQTLKTKWQDPEFRERMLASSFPRTDKWRESIAVKIRAKWEEEGYRSAVTAGIRRSLGNATRTSTRPRRRSTTQIYRSAEEKRALKEAKEEARRARREKEKAKRAMIKAAKKEKMGSIGEIKDTSIKDLLGGQLWFEEKMRRRRESDGLIDDDELERQLLEEWSSESTFKLDALMKGDTDAGEEKRENGECDEDEAYVEDDIYDGFDVNELDIIEVYDADGNLVATYDSEEYERLKS